jgi:hypothetical protein
MASVAGQTFVDWTYSVCHWAASPGQVSVDTPSSPEVARLSMFNPQMPLVYHISGNYPEMPPYRTPTVLRLFPPTGVLSCEESQS